MIKSMTGFGKGDSGGFSVEMRAVNHKFLDLSIKLPRGLLPLESRVKKSAGERFFRGRIDIYVTRAEEGERARALALDHAAVKQYLSIFNELKAGYGLSGEADLGLIASMKDIISETEEAEDLEAAWPAVQGALTAAMDSLDAMRAVEGGELTADIRARAGRIADALAKVEERAPAVVSEYQARLKERVSKLAEGVELDGGRLAQEVAIFAERCDITEEIVRGRSHLMQLGKMLDEGGPVGRKLDFLIQEINREVNTIGSKASDRKIAVLVVDMKGELEKIREQVQNLE